ncbi:MAG: response regulator transcription factor [Dermatophilaceae bacterium]|nr:response regulator transcription factor [Dermatophilaceae bacterium]
MKQDASVVLVDSRQAFLDAFALVLLAQRQLRLVGTALTVDAAVARGLPLGCDVVAIGLDDENRIEDLARLRAASPDVGVVVMVEPDDEGQLSEALAWGVRGWVLRRSGVRELLEALEKVADGEAHLPAEPVRALMAAALARHPASATPARGALTPREAAVLECLAAGMTRRDIGVALGLSDNTVRTYVRRILRKLHVHSASAAVALTSPGVHLHG